MEQEMFETPMNRWLWDAITGEITPYHQLIAQLHFMFECDELGYIDNPRERQRALEVHMDTLELQAELAGVELAPQRKLHDDFDDKPEPLDFSYWTERELKQKKEREERYQRFKQKREEERIAARADQHGRPISQQALAYAEEFKEKADSNRRARIKADQTGQSKAPEIHIQSGLTPELMDIPNTKHAVTQAPKDCYDCDDWEQVLYEASGVDLGMGFYRDVQFNYECIINKKGQAQFMYPGERRVRVKSPRNWDAW